MDIVRKVKKCPICGKVPGLKFTNIKCGTEQKLSLVCEGVVKFGYHDGMIKVTADTADETVRKWNNMVDRMVSMGVAQRDILRSFIPFGSRRSR